METHVIQIKTAYCALNPLTGDWLVCGQKRPDGTLEMPYAGCTKNEAIRLCAIVNHFNETGEQRNFKIKEALSMITWEDKKFSWGSDEVPKWTE